MQQDHPLIPAKAGAGLFRGKQERQRRLQLIRRTEVTDHLFGSRAQVFVMAALPLNESRSATIWKQLIVMPEVPLNVSVSFGK